MKKDAHRIVSRIRRKNLSSIGYAIRFKRGRFTVFSRKIEISKRSLLAPKSGSKYVTIKVFEKGGKLASWISVNHS